MNRRDHFSTTSAPLACQIKLGATSNRLTPVIIGRRRFGNFSSRFLLERWTFRPSTTDLSTVLPLLFLLFYGQRRAEEGGIMEE